MASAAEVSQTGKTPLDVWLKWTQPDLTGDDSPTYEANTFKDGDRFRVDWYHVDVGQVSSKEFDTYEGARAWLESEKFADYTS